MLCAILWFLFFHVQATFGGRSRSRSGCRRKSRERQQQQHRIWQKRHRLLPWPGFPLGFNTENVFAFHSVWCENLGWEKKWKAFFQPLFGADATFLYTWKSWRYDFLFNFHFRSSWMFCRVGISLLSLQIIFSWAFRWPSETILTYSIPLYNHLFLFLFFSLSFLLWSFHLVLINLG